MVGMFIGLASSPGVFVSFAMVVFRLSVMGTISSETQMTTHFLASVE